MDTTRITFELGEVKITARTKDIGISEIGQSEMEQFDRKDVAGTLQLIPGLSYSNSGPRNEATVTVRGFDLRQVPVYLDGVPVYVTYDGYVDLGRFLVKDIKKIAVSKGVSSILFGPNTLGGAINLVTRKPENKLEFEGSTGVYAGHRIWNGRHSDLYAGTRIKNYYFQAGYSFLDRDPYSLSGKPESPYPGNHGVLDNSQRRDRKINFKAGWMPGGNDEYAISFITQKGAKGIPAYSGSDPDQRVRYWRFPDVHNQDISFISQTAVANNGYLKTRLYYNEYFSDLRSYDDSSYSSQDMGSSFTSIYFDNSFGGSIEYNMDINLKHNLKGALHFKQDHHREHNTHPVDETVRHMKDRFITLGMEENFTPSNDILIVGGTSLNIRNNLRADNYDPDSDSIFPFPANRDMALNVQVVLDYRISKSQEIRISLARKTRFGTMKDRYSYRLGRSLPNPSLKSESAFHADVSHSIRAGSFLGMDASIFCSLLDDAIQPVYGVDTGNPDVFQLQNTGKAVYYGLEADVTCLPLDEFLLGLRYAYLERKNLDRPELIFTDVPKHRIFGYVKYGKQGIFYVRFDSGFDTERPSTSDGLYVAEAFFLCNMEASVRIWKIFSLEARINNLFDAAYSYYEGYPQEGRNFKLSLEYSISKN